MASRGGARPGAGAPQGNLNALKRGAYSRQVQSIVRAILRDPEATHAFKALMRLRLGHPPEGKGFGDPVEQFLQRFE